MKMALLAQQIFLCAASKVLLALSCAAALTLHARAAANNDAAPHAPVFTSEAAEPVVLSPEDQTEDALNTTRRADESARAEGGGLPQLTPQEHMRRAAIYQANRAFEEARAHWRALIERYPTDANVPAAHFGIGRTLFQEKRYEEALPVFQKLGDTYVSTPAGRDGFYYVAATLLRLNRPGEAAARYAEYAERFPKGERIENAYLNIIDSLREAGRADDALPWIERTRALFKGTTTDMAALFARLRLDVSRSDWQSAINTADELSRARLTRDVNTTPNEVAYLRAFSLEKSGREGGGGQGFSGDTRQRGSYYGWLATEHLEKLGGDAKASAATREARVEAEVRRAAGDFPAPFRRCGRAHVEAAEVRPEARALHHATGERLQPAREVGRGRARALADDARHRGEVCAARSSSRTSPKTTSTSPRSTCSSLPRTSAS
jgi:TolA-binding protein